MTKNVAHTKALLALLFATTTIDCRHAACAEKKPDINVSLIQHIGNSAESPEIRAYKLLELARHYLLGGEPVIIDNKFYDFRVPSGLRVRGVSKSVWTELASSAGYADWSRSYTKCSPSLANKTLAAAAINQALLSADKSEDVMAKLTSYLVASYLFRQIGNDDAVRRCQTELDNLIGCYANISNIDQNSLVASASILKLEALTILPVRIAELKSEETQPIGVYKETDLKNAEDKLLRATVLLDRLSEDNDARRRAHRDLVIWYRKLGKTEQADREKKLLFNLIGRNDEDLLFPQDGACGQVIWWQKLENDKGMSEMCGMG